MFKKENSNDIVRVMIYEDIPGEGTYLFLYNVLEDGPCTFDNWYMSIAEAEQYCSDEFEIMPSDWKLIDDPKAGGQHDWIAPMVVKRDEQGNPIWGEFEPAKSVEDRRS